MDGEQGSGAAADGRVASTPAGEYAEWARQVNRTLAELERRVAALELAGAAPLASDGLPSSVLDAPALPDGRATGGHAV